MTNQLAIALAFGSLGALLMLVSNLMKRMVPLRIFAMGANSLFMVQATVEHNWILCGLQFALLSINAWRLWTLRRLLVSLEEAHADTPLRDWLLPQMKKRTFKAGAALFRKNDQADMLYYLQSGVIRSPELGNLTRGAGHLIGEIGLFAKDHRRSVSVICDTDCVIYTMSDEAIYLMSIQNPEIGFYLIRLIAQQLFTELQKQVPAARM